MGTPRQLIHVDGRSGRQAGHPAVAAAGLEEPTQRDQVGVAGVTGQPDAEEPRQVVLDHLASQPCWCTDLGVLLGEEP